MSGPEFMTAASILLIHPKSAFKIAGAGAFKKAMDAANPVLLEPIVKLKVIVPDNYTGDIMSDLNNKRGRVMGMLPEGGYNTIEAEVPLAEVLRYAIDLKSITQGRGRYTFTFSHLKKSLPSSLKKLLLHARKNLKIKPPRKNNCPIFAGIIGCLLRFPGLLAWLDPQFLASLYVADNVRTAQ